PQSYQVVSKDSGPESTKPPSALGNPAPPCEPPPAVSRAASRIAWSSRASRSPSRDGEPPEESGDSAAASPEGPKTAGRRFSSPDAPWRGAATPRDWAIVGPGAP